MLSTSARSPPATAVTVRSSPPSSVAACRAAGDVARVTGAELPEIPWGIYCLDNKQTSPVRTDVTSRHRLRTLSVPLLLGLSRCRGDPVHIC
jgi:hypothetical protein